MDTQGGKRAGAGRPRGSLNRRTRAQLESSKALGITPLDYLLTVLRDEEAPRVERLMAARIAAPYIHSRMAARHELSVAKKGEEDRLTELTNARVKELLSVGRR